MKNFKRTFMVSLNNNELLLGEDFLVDKTKIIKVNTEEEIINKTINFIANSFDYNIKYNLWKIEGYVGFYDYDDGDPYNIKMIVPFDKSFTKEDILQIYCMKYKKYRNVVLTVNKI